MSCLEVVPRTIESSTSTTTRFLSTRRTVLNLTRTFSSRSFCPGLMNVRPAHPQTQTRGESANQGECRIQSAEKEKQLLAYQREAAAGYAPSQANDKQTRASGARTDVVVADDAEFVGAAEAKSRALALVAQSCRVGRIRHRNHHLFRITSQFSLESRKIRA